MTKRRVVLSSVRLSDFLSFHEGTISFAPGLNVIVGPNGSGKTSVFHAIKFALGSNQREERYTKWSDFIRRGANRSEGEVTVLVDGQTISFLRRVDRDGVPRSYINGRHVGANELRMRAAELGLDVDNPLVFMPQERINALREMNPNEICRLIEEGSGLSQLRQRIFTQGQSVVEGRHRLEIAISESQLVEHELMGLKDKLDRLRKKRALQEVAQQLETERRWSVFDNHRVEVETLRAMMEKTETGVVSVLQQLSQLEEQKHLMTSKLSQITGEIAGIQKEIGSIETHIQEEEKRLAQSKEESRSLLAEIGQLEKNLLAAKNTIIRLRDEHQQVSKKREQLLEDEKRLKTEIEEQEQERDRVSEEMEEFHRWNECRIRIAEPFTQLKARVDAKREERRRLQEQLHTVKVELESLESKWGRIWSELENVDEKTLLTRISELDRRLAVLEESRITESKSITESEYEIASLRSQLSEVTRRTPDTVRDFGVAVAEHGLKSVIGPLVLKMVREERYIPVIESVLRDGLLFAFITTDAADLMLLERLRENMNAPVPLILVSKTSSSIERTVLPESKDIIGWLWDILDIDDPLRDLLRSAFGEYVLVEDYRTATRLAQRQNLRVVTTDGQILVPGDGLLISYPRLEPTGLLSTAPLQARLAAVENSLQTAKIRLSEILMETESLTAERQEKVRLLNALYETRTSWARREEMQKRIPILQAQIDRLNDELKTIQDRLQDMERQLRDIDSTQPTELSKLKGKQTAITLRLKRLRYELSEIQKSQLDFELTEQRIKDDIHETEVRIQQFETQLIEKRQRLTQSGDTSARVLEVIDSLRESLKNAQRQLTEKKDLLASTERELEELRRQIQELEHTRDTSRRDLDVTRKKIEILEEELKNIESTLAGTERPAVVRALRIVQEELIRVNGKIDEYSDVTESVAERATALEEQRATLMTKIEEIREEISEAEQALVHIDKQYKQEMEKTLTRVEEEINRVLNLVEFAADVKFQLSDSDGQYGVIFKTRIKSNEYSNISAGSGGERSLIAISLILALQRFNPAPVYALDEIDIFLDATNTEMVSRLFHECARKSQFILLLQPRSTQLLKHADKSIGVVAPGGKEPSIVVEVPSFNVPTNS